MPKLGKVLEVLSFEKYFKYQVLEIKVLQILFSTSTIQVLSK